MVLIVLFWAALTERKLEQQCPLETFYPGRGHPASAGEAPKPTSSVSVRSSLQFSNFQQFVAL